MQLPHNDSEADPSTSVSPRKENGSRQCLKRTFSGLRSSENRSHLLTSSEADVPDNTTAVSIQSFINAIYKSVTSEILHQRHAIRSNHLQVLNCTQNIRHLADLIMLQLKGSFQSDQKEDAIHLMNSPLRY